MNRLRGRSGSIQTMDALVHLWMPFNAWLAQVIDDPEMSETDKYLIDAAGVDAVLSQRFSDLLAQDTRFESLAREFHSYWPIFRVRWLIDEGIPAWNSFVENRGEALERTSYRTLCFSHSPGPKHYRPQCYAGHQMASDLENTGGDPAFVPLNWAHTLSAIYQVRCNLFHGGKSFAHSSDVRLTELAFSILWRVWGEEQL